MKQEADNFKFSLEHTYTGLPKEFFTETYPAHVPNPKAVLINEKLAEDIGIDIDFLKSRKSTEILSGNKVIEGRFLHKNRTLV